MVKEPVHTFALTGGGLVMVWGLRCTSGRLLVINTLLTRMFIKMIHLKKNGDFFGADNFLSRYRRVRD